MTDAKDPRYAALVARLSGDGAASELRGIIDAALRALLDVPLREVVEANATAELLKVWSVTPALQTVRAALARTTSDEARADLSKDPRELSTFVSDAARAKLDVLARDPKIVPERLLRELAESDAATSVMNDVLFEALTEFSEKVNPFFAEWGLPALLKRVPFGAGAVMKSLEAVRGEFDKRLEPETRKFLQGFSRRASDKALAFALSRGAHPAFVTLRRDVLSAVLAQKLSDLVPPPGDDRGDALEDALLDIAERLYAELATRAKGRIDAWLQAKGDQTVAEALDAAGVSRETTLAAIGALAGPIARVLSPGLRAVLARPSLEGPLSALINDIAGAKPAPHE